LTWPVSISRWIAERDSCGTRSARSLSSRLPAWGSTTLNSSLCSLMAPHTNTGPVAPHAA